MNHATDADGLDFYPRLSGAQRLSSLNQQKKKLMSFCFPHQSCFKLFSVFWAVGCGSPVVKVSVYGRHNMSSILVVLKTHRVCQRCTLNERAETSSRWWGGVVRRGRLRIGHTRGQRYKESLKDYPSCPNCNVTQVKPTHILACIGCPKSQLLSIPASILQC
ncbi:hypothetical protein TNCV_652411 [Trichonephila clavipes]|nr:hypothetical protein TNCV_652411 [Trichonephila clavipes]